MGNIFFSFYFSEQRRTVETPTLLVWGVALFGKLYPKR
jgi:hypothetical protein